MVFDGPRSLAGTFLCRSWYEAQILRQSLATTDIFITSIRMDITNIKERLAKLDSNKLIDVVKNYRQYGYPDDVRAYAMTLLEQQGISKEDLRLTGNLENTTYNYANDIFSSYNRNSMIAFIAYCLAIVLKGSLMYHLISQGSMLSILFIFLVAVYLIFLIRSFLNQTDFNKLTGSDTGSESILIYLFLGMPFYMIMYFVFRKQMKERMSLIR